MKKQISFARLSFFKENLGGSKLVSFTQLNFLKKHLTGLIFAVLVVCFALGFYIFAWTEPSGDPSTGNVSVPLNVSNLDQTKLGALSFSEFRDVNDNTYYINPSGAVSAILSGSVGIGTTSPGGRLTIVALATAANALELRGRVGDNLADIYFKSNAGNTTYAGIEGGPIFLGLYTNDLERIRIDSNGNVGIGTTSPNAKLQVAGGDVYASTAGNGLILKSPDGLTCKRVSIDNAGNLITTAVACP